MNQQEPTIDDIRRARERIASTVRRTPLERSRWLSAESGRDVFLKLECFQLTGSFKIRGAMAKLAELGAHYGHYFKPETVPELCGEHGLTHPMLEALEG